MNMDNGYLRMLGENEKPSENEIMVALSELTMKQKDEMKVSLHDNRSVAGKKLQKARKAKKAAKKSRKRNRK